MKWLMLWPVALCCVFSVHVHAEPAATQVQQQNSAQQPLEITTQHRREAWGLNDQEWSRFEALQQGPRGFWSPQLDPLTTLGVEAENDQGRRRYAELQVKLEAKRAAGELAYQQAYSDAWARLYPGLLPVQGMATDASGSIASTVRESLFVEKDCSACLTVAKRLQDKGTAFDLYLVGSDGDDDTVRAWAKAAGIQTERVQRRQITLNHDRGRWFSLGAHGTLPARYHQVDGQWQRIE